MGDFDIYDSKDLWKLVVHIEDLWCVTQPSKFKNIEFIILDKQVS